MADAAATLPAPETDAPDVPAPAPVADLPSGEPIPSSTPPSKTPKRRSIPLVALLAALPSNVDVFLTRLDKCLATPSGIDTVMLLLCYTSKLGASVLSSLSQSALRRSAREWIALVAALPRGTTVLFSSPVSEGSTKATVHPAAALALLLSKRLSALSSLLSEARMILRLWALLGMYFWARRLLGRILAGSKPGATSEKQDGSAAAAAAAPGPSKLETAIELVRLGLCATFQALENGAYLSSRGVLGWSPDRQRDAFRWSARLWGAYVGIEIGRLAAERFGPGGGTPFAARSAREKNEWAKKMARQLAWAPLTVHWGSEKGLVSDMTVGLLATIPGVIQIRDLWASTA